MVVVVTPAAAKKGHIEAVVPELRHIPPLRVLQPALLRVTVTDSFGNTMSCPKETVVFVRRVTSPAPVVTELHVSGDAGAVEWALVSPDLAGQQVECEAVFSRGGLGIASAKVVLHVAGVDAWDEGDVFEWLGRIGMEEW